MKYARLALRCLSTSVLALAAAQAGAACYTVYDASGHMLHSAGAPPTSAAQAGSLSDGARVVLNGEQCAAGPGVAEQIAPARAAASAPLLTDAHTAAAAQAPYALVARGIAVVAPANAEQVWRSAPIADAPAARPAMLTVITEWADGRTEVEQRPAPPRR